MPRVRRELAWIAALVVAAAPSAHADPEDHGLYDRLWPELPTAGHLTLSEQVTDQLTELGNMVGHHLDVLSYDLLALQFDGRQRRARVRFGTAAAERYLTFKFDSSVHVVGDVAQIHAHLDLGIAGYTIGLDLPELEMAPASYRGERGVELRLPLFKRSF